MRLVASQVTYRYPHGDHEVLTGVDFTVASGAAAAIVGPSGSGKTTLLSLMGRLLPMQHGAIHALDSTGRRRSLSETASWVLQTVSLLPDRTVLDNIALGAYSAGASRSEARTRSIECLSAVGLFGRENDPARILSGGEAQRVAIARALASDTPIILADEPTGQLDAQTSRKVLDALIGAHGERTVVIVTHDPEVAARCDTVLELRDGEIFEHLGGRA
ncbi:ABC transporter ATP-binding protein [Demequina sp. NBRC 110055]|uniref:ABC transporter ATP-binding protein n=1 Tax=Demequina sp. NBRC 110055 TaxID=1570344 RepID=UPI0009FEE75F|nr:ATP-binding cassette domain-containing protein [Demequina sp. NBRC 110055]